MTSRRFLWRLYLSYLAIVAAALLALGWYAMRVTQDIFLARSRSELTALSAALEPAAASLVATPGRDQIQQEIVRVGHRIDKRITLILPSGEVIADSSEAPQQMDNHITRPEVQQALRGDIGESVRYSHTLLKDHLYLARPIRVENKIAAVLRISLPLESVTLAVLKVDRSILVITLALVLCAGVLAYAVYRRTIAPLERLKMGAQRFAEGDLGFRLHADESLEMRELCEALNNMASQLEERLSTVVEQKNEQDVMLSGMLEGILAVDNNERVLRANRAAENLLGCQENPHGKMVAEVVRNADLQRFIRDVLKKRAPAEREISMTGAAAESRIRVAGNTLRDSTGNEIGMLLVMHDITRLRRLENLRRDFVANVSHELRTPITSIKASVETLLEGAVARPDDARNFVQIIARHSDRLSRIIEDLLSLARLEDEKARADLIFEDVLLNEVLGAALQACEERSRERNVALDLQCPADILLHVNATLIEQAVVNLVSNAIEYSEKGSRVLIRGSKNSSEAQIQVVDSGCGIGADHLPRVFERFYRVDKARSRKSGGTGLGLSIVKHITEIHRGSVAVESLPGKGSTFTINLQTVQTSHINHFHN